MALAKEHVDEEFYPLIDHLKEIGEQFSSLDEQQRLEYMKKWLLENYDAWQTKNRG